MFFLMNKYKKVIRNTLFLIGLLFILILVKESSNEFFELMGQIELDKFALSILIGVIGNITMAFLFARLLGKHGIKISNFLALKMYMIGQIAKYIPGKIWGIAYQASHVAGVSGAMGVILANIEMMIGVMFMTSVIAIALLCLLVNKWLAFTLLLLGMLIFAFIYKTNVVNRIAQALSGRFKAIKISSKMKSEKTSLPAGATFYLIFCLVYILSYILMFDAVFGFSIEESIVYIALLSLAWLGGVLIFIVPAGMGVRELLFIAASSYIAPQNSIEMLASIAILCRFWQVTQELVGALLLTFLHCDKTRG